MANIWLAPLHGITLYSFRNCLFRHTCGVKTAVTPFFPIQESAKLNVKKHADFQLENNTSNVEIIPQLIGNRPDHFVDTVNALNSEFGYTRFNWNIGCPMKQITKKKRGCGIMPYPQMVEDVASTVTSKTNCRLSVKMRLGMCSPDESLEILERLNSYPIDFIVIHPRLGIDQYEGKPDLEALERCLETSVHKVVYSGDIQTADDCMLLKQRFPQIDDWMLGRGILANPFLAELILAAEKSVQTPSRESLRQRFTYFYKDLITSMLNAYGEHRVLANMKELWHYFSRFFNMPQDELQELLRVVDFSEFMTKTIAICEN